MADDESKDASAPVIRAADLIARLRKYNTRDLLAKVNHSIRTLQETRQPPYEVKRRVVRKARVVEESVYFTPFALAFLAKFSILVSNDFRSREVTPAQLFELVGLYGLLEDPFMQDKSEGAAYRFLFRTSWEQFTFQESPKALIPRYYTMFRILNDQDTKRVLDIAESWKNLTGISIEDFITLGFGAWAMASAHSVFLTQAFQRSPVQAIAQRADTKTLEAFFKLTATDYAGFRRMSEGFKLPDMRYAKTEFNLLRRYPLIQPRRHELIAPIPQLVLQRVTRGIYYDLMDAHAAGTRNPFLEQFGRVFEQYVGELLKAAYGSDRVFHEPVYGKEEQRGPDWILLDGDVAILFECTVSGTRLVTRSVAETEDVTRDFLKVYGERIAKYKSKVDDLKAGRTGLDVSRIRRFIPVVVTHEPMYLEPLVRALMTGIGDPGWMAEEGVALVDVGDIEVITGWNDKLSLVRVLDDWRDAYRQEPQALSAFLPNKARTESLPWHNSFLAGVQDRFLGEHLPGEGEEESSG